MNSIVPAMISTSSLAALSAALAPSLSASGVGASRAVPVDAVQGAPAKRTAPATGSGGGGGANPLPVLRPGQILPRGSLLNLSV